MSKDNRVISLQTHQNSQSHSLQQHEIQIVYGFDRTQRERGERLPMNNAFPFVEARGEETNGSLMGLMRLGSRVEEGQHQLLAARPSANPANEAAEKRKGGQEFAAVLFQRHCFFFPGC